jgi:hypothetical protein
VCVSVYQTLKWYLSIYNLVQTDGKHPREEDSGVFGGMRAAGGDFSRFLEKTKKIVYLFRVVSVCRYTKTTGTDL